MSIEHHQQCLSNMCRICGARALTFNQLRKNFRKRFCENVKDEIYMFYGIDVSSDTENHPKVMCLACYNRVKKANVLVDDSRLDKKEFLGEKEKASIVSALWQPHKRVNCQVCETYNSQAKQGRHKHVKRCGKPKCVTSTHKETDTENIFSHLFDTVSKSPEKSMLEIDNMLPGQKETFICQLCQCIFSMRTVRSKCDHYFCSECLSNLFLFRKTGTVDCPICHKAIRRDEIKVADERFKQQLSNIEVVCKKCKYTGPMYTIIFHNCGISTADGEALRVETESETNDVMESITDTTISNSESLLPLESTPVPSINFRSGTIQERRKEIETQTSPILNTSPIQNRSLQSTLKRAMSSPLSREEEKVHTHLTKRKLIFAKEKGTISYETGGQPMILKRLIKQ